jgi:hypothetical protein
MKEQEYINLSEKVALDCAIDVLGRIVPENSVVLPASEFIILRQKLWRWRDKYYKILKVK